MPVDAGTARRGRLTPQREAELYEAVLDLLCEVGYDALTMDAVAARTHSSKATLYRQWKGKPELVVHALRHDKPGGDVAAIDTGTLRGDLHALVDAVSPRRMERENALRRAMAHAVHTNPDLCEALRELLVEPAVAGVEVLLHRAVGRGEIRADVPALPFVAHALFGAVLSWEIIENRPMTPDFLGTYLDAVVLPSLGL
ncbi:TetR/AcrR family transcriptional regulator [Longispora sp. NPDC051575]|uniref:TetR/AcrR family transcriptional regulator n=1 Tax=Longispora sp. NPDC051575 TaxID=3154943 RepID=UPI0034193C83